MIEKPLRWAAVVCSVLVISGWGLFAIDEARTASKQTAEEVAGNRAATQADPSPREERARERIHGDVREGIDDANDVLLAPFAGVTDSSGSKWTRRTIPALIAFVVYGFGLGYLARFARGRA